MAAVCQKLRVRQHQKGKSGYSEQKKKNKENIWETFLWAEIRNAALCGQVKDA